MAGAATELTDANFADMTAKGVAVVDFWAEWCPPCRMEGPIIEKIAEEYVGRAVVGKLDTDASRDTAAKFGVQSIPTIVILKDGTELNDLAIEMPDFRDRYVIASGCR